MCCSSENFTNSIVLLELTSTRVGQVTTVCHVDAKIWKEATEWRKVDIIYKEHGGLLHQCSQNYIITLPSLRVQQKAFGDRDSDTTKIKCHNLSRSSRQNIVNCRRIPKSVKVLLTFCGRSRSFTLRIMTYLRSWWVELDLPAILYVPRERYFEASGSCSYSLSVMGCCPWLMLQRPC